jgi:hypothetical protein
MNQVTLIICQIPPRFRKQRGVTTLIISLIILMLSTLVVFNVSKAILMEQKISNNDTRAKQAFEAAEAGINVALDYLNTNPDRDGVAGIDPVFDLNPVDGIGETSLATIGSATVMVTITGTPAAPGIITAEGVSNDGTATKTLTISAARTNPLPNGPQNPIIVRGGLIVGGNASVVNPEGFSTIWSGSDVDVSTNQTDTTMVPDLSSNGYPACMDIPMTCATVNSSNKNVVGVDVVENDASLSSLTANQFFQNFFGMTQTAYQASMVTINATTATAEASVTNALSEVIWVEGGATINGNGTMGSLTQPSILIVNGNLSVQGGFDFFGIVYVTGTIDIQGTSTVTGAAIVAGANNSNASGNLTITFNSSVINNTSLAGSTTGGAGSWRDFD